MPVLISTRPRSIVLSRTKGQHLSLSIPGLDFRVTADQDAVLVTTYMPEAKFNVTYYKSVPLSPGTTINQAGVSANRLGCVQPHRQ
jgi:hypothetical protein